MLAASVRIAFMRASGAKGLPFSMPIEAKRPALWGRSLPAALLDHRVEEFQKE